MRIFNPIKNTTILHCSRMCQNKKDFKQKQLTPPLRLTEVTNSPSKTRGGQGALTQRKLTQGVLTPLTKILSMLK